MKQNFIISLAAGIVAVMVTACTNLDVDVESQYVSYPNSDIAQEAELADVYYHLRTTWGCHYMEAQALSSDEWVGLSFSGDYYDSGTFAHPTLHNFNYTDQSLNWFNDVSAGITKANLAIADLTKKGAKTDRIASVRAMRAFFHWVLMDSFGDVPILEGVPSDTTEVVRCKRADVARFIERELLDIIPQLPIANDASTYGKPTRWMAEAVLVKLYLNWPVYMAPDVTQYDAATATNEKLDDVVKHCDNIINSGLFSLSEGAQGYCSKFWPNNGAQIKDFIYAIIIEELGVEGAVAVAVLYIMLLFRTGRIASRCENNFPALLAMGLALLLVTQALFNMCVAVGLAPVTGQPLPLISKGGTSTMINCIYVGVILSVSRSAKKKGEPGQGETKTEVSITE